MSYKFNPFTGLLDWTSEYTHPNHSGDVTSSGDGAQTIASGAVTLAKMANLAANAIIGNNTASPATPIALTVAQTRTLLGLGTGDSPSFTGLTISGLTSGRVPYLTTGGALTSSANLTFNSKQLALAQTGSAGGLMIGGDAPWYRTTTGTIGGPVKIAVSPTATDAHFYPINSTSVFTVTTNATLYYRGNYVDMFCVIAPGVTQSGDMTGVNGTVMRSRKVSGGDSGTLTNQYGIVGHVGATNLDVFSNPTTTNVYGFYSGAYYRRGTTTTLYEFYAAPPSTISVPSAWASATEYVLNTLVAPTVDNGCYYVCQTAGTSGGTEPTWSTTPGDTVTDNGVVWYVLIKPSIGTAYGLYIAAQTAATTNYAIYSAGTTTPSVHLGPFVVGAAVTAAGNLDVVSATGGVLVLRRNDTSITAGDVVGQIDFYAKDTSTTTNVNPARIQVTAPNTISTDINPGVMKFYTTGTGVGGALIECLALSAGSAAQIGFFGATPVVKPTALTAQLTTITHTAPGTPDYAVQDLTNSSGYGFVTKDEGNTVLSVIANLQTRLSELETKLKNLGLLT